MVIKLLDRVRKIHILRGGFVVGAIYRARKGVVHRGTLRKQPGDVAKIFYCGGRTETVRQ